MCTGVLEGGQEDGSEKVMAKLSKFNKNPKSQTQEAPCILNRVKNTTSG
jgi:hypothetical protein